MQSKFTILLLSACIFLFAQVQAACTCDANDTACLQSCVIQGQGCITACNGDNACYDNCIANFWPGQTVASSTVAPVVPSVTAQPSGAVTSAPVTTSAPVVVASSSAPVVAASSSAVSPVVSPVVSGSRPVVSNSATFSPTAPTSATPPEPTTSGAQSSFLVPAVAIGVASVTVITQVFFLARMGSVLFN